MFIRCSHCIIFTTLFICRLGNECPTDTHKTETESVKDKNVELAHQGKQCSSLNFRFISMAAYNVLFCLVIRFKSGESHAGKRGRRIRRRK